MFHDSSLNELIYELFEASKVVA